MDGRENPARDPARPRTGPAAAAGSRDDLPASRAGVRIPPFITRQGHGMNDRWPLQDFLELGALVSAVPCARLHARQVLWEWGIGNLGDSAELLVTELITNAVRASREAGRVSAVRLWLLSDSAQILILVWDASPRPPVLTDAGDEAEHGRGLMLVDAVSEQTERQGTDLKCPLQHASLALILLDILAPPVLQAAPPAAPQRPRHRAAARLPQPRRPGMAPDLPVPRRPAGRRGGRADAAAPARCRAATGASRQSAARLAAGGVNRPPGAH